MIGACRCLRPFLGAGMRELRGAGMSPEIFFVKVFFLPDKGISLLRMYIFLIGLGLARVGPDVSSLSKVDR